VSTDPALVWTLRLGLAGVWLLAARHKLVDASAFRAAVSGYRIVPELLTGGVAWALIVAELAVALGLLVPATSAPAAAAGAALLVLYTGAMAINLARGRRDLACGCSWPGSSRPVGEGLLVRNGLLGALSLFAMSTPAVRSLGWLDAFSIAAGAATLLLLHAGAEAALANAPRSRALGRRTWATR